MADYVNKLKKKQTQKQTNTTPSLCMEINLQIRALTWVSQELQNLTFAFKSWKTIHSSLLTVTGLGLTWLQEVSTIPCHSTNCFQEKPFL
jgi:hypothetical protein